MKFPVQVKNNKSYYTREVTLKRVRVAGPISPAESLGSAATKKRRSGGEPLVDDTVSELIEPGIEPQTSRADSSDFNCYANRR